MQSEQIEAEIKQNSYNRVNDLIQQLVKMEDMPSFRILEDEKGLETLQSTLAGVTCYAYTVFEAYFYDPMNMPKDYRLTTEEFTHIMPLLISFCTVQTLYPYFKAVDEHINKFQAEAKHQYKDYLRTIGKSFILRDDTFADTIAYMSEFCYNVF